MVRLFFITMALTISMMNALYKRTMKNAGLKVAMGFSMP